MRRIEQSVLVVFFFFQAEDGIRDVAVTGVQTCALPISLLSSALSENPGAVFPATMCVMWSCFPIQRESRRRIPMAPSVAREEATPLFFVGDRKSTRLNSSHGYISYAVFCLKQKIR